MAKMKKLGTAIGHNRLTKESEAQFLKRDAEIIEDIAKLNDDRKANLRDAKDAGMSLESRQAMQEVEDQKKHYIAICREMNIFNPDTMEAA